MIILVGERAKDQVRARVCKAFRVLFAPGLVLPHPSPRNDIERMRDAATRFTS